MYTFVSEHIYCFFIIWVSIQKEEHGVKEWGYFK